MSWGSDLLSNPGKTIKGGIDNGFNAIHGAVDNVHQPMDDVIEQTAVFIEQVKEPVADLYDRSGANDVEDDFKRETNNASEYMGKVVGAIMGHTISLIALLSNDAAIFVFVIVTVAVIVFAPVLIPAWLGALTISTMSFIIIAVCVYVIVKAVAYVILFTMYCVYSLISFTFSFFGLGDSFKKGVRSGLLLTTGSDKLPNSMTDIMDMYQNKVDIYDEKFHKWVEKKGKEIIEIITNIIKKVIKFITKFIKDATGFDPMLLLLVGVVVVVVS